MNFTIEFTEEQLGDLSTMITHSLTLDVEATVAQDLPLSKGLRELFACKFEIKMMISNELGPVFEATALRLIEKWEVDLDAAGIID